MIRERARQKHERQEGTGERMRNEPSLPPSLFPSRSAAVNVHAAVAAVDRGYDDEQRRLRAEPAAAHAHGVESRMRAYERQCESRAHEWAVAEAERLKVAAVEKARAEERARCRVKLAQMQREVDRAAADQEHALQLRMADAEAAAKARHADADRANYEARQRLLAMMDRAQVRKSLLASLFLLS